MLEKSNQVEKIINIWKFQIEKRSIWLGLYWLFVLWIEINKLQINKLASSEKDLIDLCKKENALFIQIETFDLDKIEKDSSLIKESSGILKNDSWKNHLKSLNKNGKTVNSPLIKGARGILKNDSQKNINFKYFKIWYYKKFITPYTAIINLEKTEEEILATMKAKWRYNIRLAEKKWIKVDFVEKTDSNIKIFYDLMLETTSRDKFAWNSFSYYKTFLEKIDNSKLLIAFYEDIAIASWIFVFDKEVSIYYYWASTNDKNYRNMMAPYLLQWAAIKKAKEIWSKYYDFLWIASPWEKSSSLAWVTDFKLKLTQDIVKVSESYIWIDNKILYTVLNILKLVKSKIKK